MTPDYLDLEAWEGYLEMRRLKKKPMTDRAKKRAFNTLERLYKEGEDITLVLEQSEDKGYTGLFKVSESYKVERGLISEKSGHKLSPSDAAYKAYKESKRGGGVVDIGHAKINGPVK